MENIEQQIAEMNPEAEFIIIRAQRSTFKDGMFSVKKRAAKQPDG